MTMQKTPWMFVLSAMAGGITGLALAMF